MLPRAPPQGALCFPQLALHASSLVTKDSPSPQVSLVLLAKSLGATAARSRADLLVSGSIAEGSTSLARRSFDGLSRVFAKMSSRSSAEARDVSGGEASSSASVQQQV